MQGTALAQQRSALLEYAVSKLNPDVFSHPVWIRFGKGQLSDPLGLVADLLSAVKNLLEIDPGAACQILLICAVYQNHAGQHYEALKTTHRAIVLAEHRNLSRERLWAIWGACAISVQHENYEHAEDQFIDLQAVFGTENDWMLASFVDVLRQSLSHPLKANGGLASISRDDQRNDNLLTFAVDWLQHWGFSSPDLPPEFGAISRNSASNSPVASRPVQSFSPLRRWQGRWRSLVLAFRGEVRLQWAEHDSQIPKRRASFWRFMLNALRQYFSNQNMDFEADRPQTVQPVLLAPVTESPPKAKSRKKKAASQPQNVKRKHRREQSSTSVPVAVHMLGSFSLTVGDLAIKLPASRGLSLLKYILLHHKQSPSREMLMDVFWPEAEPEMARNNLNVAIHSLRKALRTRIFFPVIGFEDGAYGLESNLQVWLDVEEFEKSVKAGQRFEARNQVTTAVTEYETAISLYQGDFLEQDPYEEWTVMDRERLRINYLDTLDRLSQIYFDQEHYAACITVCQLVLARDGCREDTHCLLMRCYSRQGQFHLAVRQYQICEEVLRKELDIDPARETTELYEKVRQHQNI